uniref:Uncharacterized protein n=1 Tax=virus sp. ctLl75 TaxID=2828249 RepID=A0A8S5RBE6_9VIRU|nr:MAG TPA: hypothetical protein [virus sp. ctLl75]DAN52394.1 MAG TPA: hypothetical protein [Caudoviricetes sp.]
MQEIFTISKLSFRLSMKRHKKIIRISCSL